MCCESQLGGSRPVVENRSAGRLSGSDLDGDMCDDRAANDSLPESKSHNRVAQAFGLKGDSWMPRESDECMDKVRSCSAPSYFDLESRLDRLVVPHPDRTLARMDDGERKRGAIVGAISLILLGLWSAVPLVAKPRRFTRASTN